MVGCGTYEHENVYENCILVMKGIKKKQVDKRDVLE